MAYKKIEDKIHKWAEKGDYIEGELVSSEESRTFGNKVYKFKTEDDETIVVFGTAVLDSQMAGVELGDKVKIEYLGEKENKKKGQNSIKLFEVSIWED